MWSKSSPPSTNSMTSFRCIFDDLLRGQRHEMELVVALDYVEEGDDSGMPQGEEDRHLSFV